MYTVSCAVQCTLKLLTPLFHHCKEHNKLQRTSEIVQLLYCTLGRDSVFIFGLFGGVFTGAGFDSLYW